MKLNYYEIATRYLENAGVDFKVFDIYNIRSIPPDGEIEVLQRIKKCHSHYMAECWDEANLEYINTLFSVALCDLTFKEYGLQTLWINACEAARLNMQIFKDLYEEKSKAMKCELMDHWHERYYNSVKKPVIFTVHPVFLREVVIAAFRTQFAP